MILGDIVNLCIGLALIFGTVALAASAISEAIASVFNLRAKTLLSGLKRILNDDDLSGLAGQILNHGAANPQGPGDVVAGARTASTTPSYIPPQQFALAMIDILQKPPEPDHAPVELADAVAALADPQLRTLFSGIITRAKGDTAQARDDIAAWFDDSMDRLSGTYKRQTQLISFLAGLAVALAFNIDSFALTRALWDNPQLTVSANIGTGTCDGTSATCGQAFVQLAKLKDAGFPIGWRDASWPWQASAASTAQLPHGNGFPIQHCTDWLVKLFGWLVTASAALFGAPFWFDLLQRFVQLRSTGTTPAEKKAAAA